MGADADAFTRYARVAVADVGTAAMTTPYDVPGACRSGTVTFAHVVMFGGRTGAAGYTVRRHVDWCAYAVEEAVPLTVAEPVAVEEAVPLAVAEPVAVEEAVPLAVAEPVADEEAVGEGDADGSNTSAATSPEERDRLRFEVHPLFRRSPRNPRNTAARQRGVYLVLCSTGLQTLRTLYSMVDLDSCIPSVKKSPNRKWMKPSLGFR